MPSMARMSGGPLEEKMGHIKKNQRGIMLQTYQQFSSCYL